MAAFPDSIRRYAIHRLSRLAHTRWDVFHRTIRDIKLSLQYACKGAFLQVQMHSNYLWGLAYRPYGTGHFMQHKTRLLDVMLQRESQKPATFFTQCLRTYDGIWGANSSMEEAWSELLFLNHRIPQWSNVHTMVTMVDEKPKPHDLNLLSLISVLFSRMFQSFLSNPPKSRPRFSVKKYVSARIWKSHCIMSDGTTAFSSSCSTTKSRNSCRSGHWRNNGRACRIWRAGGRPSSGSSSCRWPRRPYNSLGCGTTKRNQPCIGTKPFQGCS